MKINTNGTTLVTTTTPKGAGLGRKNKATTTKKKSDFDLGAMQARDVSANNYTPCNADKKKGVSTRRQ